ncbi:TNF receptor-associated factor 6-like [Amblyomma americanum]
MPPGSLQYTLVGFSPELDWRPLKFVKQTAPTGLCSACGLVQKRTALLPCKDALCESCYDECVQEGLHVCPLDGYECQHEDGVEWNDTPAEELLRRQVRCWNAERGCRSVMAASEVFRHFQRECGHHSVSCPKCSADVLCSDVCSHLMSGCRTKVTSLETPAAVTYESGAAIAFLNTFRAELEQQAAESRRLFERLVADNAMHGDTLNGVCHAINTLKESLKQEFAAQTQQNHEFLIKGVRDITVSAEEVKMCVTTLGNAIINIPGSVNTLQRTLEKDLEKTTKGTRDQLMEIGNSIKAEVKENTQTAVEKIREFIAHPKLQVAVSIFSIKGVQELKDKALKQGWAAYVSEKVYLRGYCIRPGVILQKEGELIKLYARIVLCKGDMDGFLQWPFQHKVSLCVVHPKDGSIQKYVGAAKHFYEELQKPTQSENEPLYFSGHVLDLDDLIKGGFVEKDNLMIRWELHP